MRRAFTLIELLVVVSIIALLIAILLPVLGAARRGAQEMPCAVDQRSLGTASYTWATDKKGWLPDLHYPPSYAPNSPERASFTTSQTGDHQLYWMARSVDRLQRNRTRRLNRDLCWPTRWPTAASTGRPVSGGERHR